MKHFTVKEFEASATATQNGIPNRVTAQAAGNIEEFVNNLLDPLREGWAIRCANDKLGTPAIVISSGYRSQMLNRMVGGSDTSAHTVGYAADLVPQNGRMVEFRDFVVSFLRNKKYDQLIIESVNDAGVPKWLHVGYKNREGRQRRENLVMRGGTYYKA